jgi:anti-sigma factor RsiW
VAKGLACKELVELITEYLEGTLPRRLRKRVEKHLGVCDGCTAYLEQMRFMIQTAGRLTEESLPEPMKAELVAAFRDWHSGQLDEE